MTRMLRAAATSANTTSTAMTMRAAMALSSFRASVHDERGGPPNFDDLHPLAGVDHLVVVVAAGRPHLAADPHAADALVVGDPLEHDRRPADERSGTRAYRRGQLAVAAGDGAQRGEDECRGGHEHDRRQRGARPEQAHDRCDGGTECKRGEVEAA